MSLPPRANNSGTRKLFALSSLSNVMLSSTFTSRFKEDEHTHTGPATGGFALDEVKIHAACTFARQRGC